MRRSLGLAAALLLLVPAAPSPAADLAAKADNHLFAGGGTNLTNGVFFPGTAGCDKDGCETVLDPLQIERGTNIEFVNLDASFVTNSHRVLSFKRRKNGKPFFYSKNVDGPGTTTIRTQHLKPGLYFYLCTTHSGMFGAVEVLK